MDKFQGYEISEIADNTIVAPFDLQPRRFGTAQTALARKGGHRRVNEGKLREEK